MINKLPDYSTSLADPAAAKPQITLPQTIPSDSGETYVKSGGSEIRLMEPGMVPPSPQPRPLWIEVQKLGIWGSLAPLNTPLSTAFSAAAKEDLEHLLAELDARGFSFSLITDPNHPRQYGTDDLTLDSLKQGLFSPYGADNTLGRLAVSLGKPGDDDKKEESLDALFHKKPARAMQQAKVHNFRDLMNLENIGLRGDTGSLDDAPLARNLKELEKCGAEFHILEGEGRDGYGVSTALKDKSSRPVGLYGAYRALKNDEKDAQSLWLKFPEGGYYPLQKPEDLDTARFFLEGAHVPALGTNPLARRLRDLEGLGIDFHRGEEYDKENALSIFHALGELGYGKIGMSIQGVGRENLQVCRGEAPTPGRHLLEMADFYRNTIEPEIGRNAMTAKEGHYYLQGVDYAHDAMPPKECYAAMQKLRAFEQEILPELKGAELTRVAVTDFISIIKALTPDRTVDEVTVEYQELRRRSIMPGVASDAIRYFHDKLKPRSFSDRDFSTERERLLEIAPLTSSFNDLPQVRQALQIDVAEPYEERLKALRNLAEAQSAVPRAWDCKTTPMQDAQQDYVSLLPWPRKSLSQAALLLAELHQILGGRIDVEQRREIYAFLQRGIQQGALGDNAPDMFTKEFELAQDVDFSLQMLHADPGRPESYETRAEAVKILREGAARLKPEKGMTRDSQAEQTLDTAAADYRFLMGLGNRNLIEDASALTGVHKALEGRGDLDMGRDIIREFREGKLDVRTGRELQERLDTELILAEDLEIARRALRGEFPGTIDDRKALNSVLSEGIAALQGTEEEKKTANDYRLLLGQHCSRFTLADEADTLLMLHRSIVPAQGWEASRGAYAKLMTSLREGPWSDMPLKEGAMKFISDYLVSGDLDSSLQGLELPPAGGADSSIDFDDDNVVIGGMRLKIRRMDYAGPGFRFRHDLR